MSTLSPVDSASQPELGRWRSLVEATLRGASFDRKMNRSLPGGLTLPALSTERPADASVEQTARLLARSGRWEVSALHGDTASVDALLADVERGADSLLLETSEVESLARMWALLPLERMGVVVRGLREPNAALDALATVAESRGLPLDAIWGAVAADPWSAFLADGADLPDAALFDALAAAVRRPRSKYLAVLGVSGMAATESGGSAVSELALLLASGASLLREGQARGLSVEQLAQSTRLFVGAGRDQLVTIALMRATRVCWARLCAAFGSADVQASRAQLHAVQSSCWLTRHDPWVNLLRSTMAGFSASVGGADAISLRAYDAVGGSPEALGLRMATNTQLLLAEESHLGVVSDPAAGSYTLEQLTDALCRAAWARMQELEAAGGLAQAAGRQLLADVVAEERAELARAIDTRKVSVVGVSDFPTLSGQVVAAASSPSSAALLPPIRHAAGWEDLRDAADALAAGGDRPAVFLATWGPLSRHSARAMFSANLLQAGGLATVDPGGAREVDALVSAFAASGLAAAVICGADADYATVVPDLAAALRAAGARAVWVAGRPPDPDTAAVWRSAGVSDFAFLGCEARALLSRLHTTLGVSA